MSAAQRENTAPTPNNAWYNWYQQFDQTHSPQQRREWYSQAAESYRQARPRYPQSILDTVIKQANLTASSRLLELGCGPGIATADLAPQGFTIQAVEPSLAACELARQACKGYEKVVIANSTFEDWPLPAQKFDAVLAATSFHWISPEVACKKSADALQPNGSLILLWATPPQPNATILDALQPVYEQHHLTDLGKEQHRSQAQYQQSFETFANTVGNSGWFEITPVEFTIHHSRYSIAKYIALLSTLSSYIALEPGIRSRLFADLAQTLANELAGKTTELETTHYFAHQVAPMKSSL